MSKELRNGIGRFSKVLEASEERRVVMDLEMLWRDLQVREVSASSSGVSHGRTSSAQSKKEDWLALSLSLSLSFSSWWCRLLGSRLLLSDGCWSCIAETEVSFEYVVVFRRNFGGLSKDGGG